MKPKAGRCYAHLKKTVLVTIKVHVEEPHPSRRFSLEAFIFSRLVVDVHLLAGAEDPHESLLTCLTFSAFVWDALDLTVDVQIVLGMSAGHDYVHDWRPNGDWEQDGSKLQRPGKKKNLSPSS